MDYCTTDRRLHMASRKSRNKVGTKENLTKAERKLCKVLQTVSGKNAWCYAIRNTIGGKHPLDRDFAKDFRKLIESLYEQLQDDRKTMIKILDQEAVEALEDFFS